MSTDTDGAPPSVSGSDSDGRGSGGRRRAGGDGNGTTSSWLQEEIERRVAANRSGRGARHAARDDAEPYPPPTGAAAPRPGSPGRPPPPPPPAEALGGPSLPPGLRSGPGGRAGWEGRATGRARYPGAPAPADGYRPGSPARPAAMPPRNVPGGAPVPPPPAARPAQGPPPPQTPPAQGPRPLQAPRSARAVPPLPAPDGTHGLLAAESAPVTAPLRMSRAGAGPDVAVPEQRRSGGPTDGDPADPDTPVVSERVRVVLSERKRAAPPVRTVEVVQEGTGVGQLLRTSLIRSQLTVALWFAAAAGLSLGALPLIFALFPGIGRAEFLGLRVPWLLLGVLVYPFLLGLGWWHTRTAERVEQNFADHVQD